MDKMRMLIFGILLSVIHQVVIGQSFTDIKAGLTGVAESSCKWLDADRDGDKDIIAIGEFYQGSNPQIRCDFYRNLRNDRFTRVSSGLPNVFRGDLSIADFNLDGIDDVAIIGELKGGKRLATIYKGLSNGSFIPTGIQFTPVRDGSIDFGDFDGDGDPDILLAGESANGPVLIVYRNDRNNKFSLHNNNLPGIRCGVARWINYNLNGYLDVFVTGIGSSGSGISVLLENTGQGFTPISSVFTPLKNSNVAFGDIDNDGDDDILILGETANGKPQTRLYRNERQRGFALIGTPFVDVKDGFADWGDMDHDGDFDLLISGESANGPVSKVYVNERGSGFTDINAQIIPLYNSSGQWGDYDLDGDLDVLIAGLTQNQDFIARVYRNDGYQDVKKASNSDEQFISDLQATNPERAKPIYFFVYSSTYSDLYKQGEKAYFTFISPVKRIDKSYVLEEKFNAMIMSAYPTYPLIDQGNIVQNGFSTMEEAKRSRARVIKEYQSKQFKVIEINW